MQVASVEVEIPAELLRLGFEFIDTPGVGSAIAANTATTLRYLPQADAVVFVTGFDSALTGTETDFLTTAAGQSGKAVPGHQQARPGSDRDAAEVTRYVQRWARAQLSRRAAVVRISALQALGGAEQSTPALADSGIGPLGDALTRFLTTEQGRVSLRDVAAAAVAWSAVQRDLPWPPWPGRRTTDVIVAPASSRG